MALREGRVHAYFVCVQERKGAIVGTVWLRLLEYICRDHNHHLHPVLSTVWVAGPFEEFRCSSCLPAVLDLAALAAWLSVLMC